MLDAGPLLHWDTHAHGYQRRAAAHLWNSAAAALWLSPGYGKTTAVLHAFKALLHAGRARHMLVIAPLRVVQTVWAQEIEHWASLHGLVVARLHGPKKGKQLERRDVNVWLINYEGIPWLAEQAKKGKIKQKFDVVVADEIRRFKNSQGKRFKAARPLFKMADYCWGLTGTPAANGLLDLFGQFLILDDGAALGKTLTRYRTEYFEQGFDGFTYVPRPGAADLIEARIAPYVFRADGQLDLPDFVDDPRVIPLDSKAKATYAALKRDMITRLGDEAITAANAAVLYGKLKQMAHGRVYGEDRTVHHVHDAKQEALRELIEELGDEQLLIAYEYNHDLDQLREVLGEDLPTLSGTTDRQANALVDAWNRGEIQYLAAYPGESHGLNIQKSGAHHILWWGPTIDLDRFIQFNDRLHRQGNVADAVVLHTFIAEGTVDESTIAARSDKDAVQNALLSALTAEFGSDTVIDTATKRTPMELQFQPDAQQAQQPASQQAPQGWGQQPTQGQPPAQNPFGGQPPAQGQPQGQPPAQNPFGASQQGQQPPQGQAPQGWGPQPTQGQPQGQAPTNPFGGQPPVQGQGPNPAQQQEAIRQEVAAPPPQAPTANQAFAAHGVAMGADNPSQGGAPAGWGQQPVEDAQVVQEQPKPQPAPAHTDTGWQNPQSGRNEANDAGVSASIGDEAPTVAVPTAAPEGMVPLYTFVPADKLDAVLSAIGRAVKPKASK